LILLDIQMPLMDGFQVARVLRQNALLRNVPILAVTASDDKRRAAIEAGCMIACRNRCCATESTNFSRDISNIPIRNGWSRS